MIQAIKNLYLRLFKADEVEIINNGYLKEEEDERDYIFGADDKGIVIREDGQWAEVFTPEAEHQNKRNVDVMACVTFSLMNAFEFLAFYKWGEKWNKSDRYVAKMSNTTKGGNSMRQVIDTVRKISGTVDEEIYPFGDHLNWNEYYKSISKDIIEQGQVWLKGYEVNYTHVLNNPKMMMDALRYSPLWVAGFAWAKSGEYYRSWGRANHAFLIVGYKEGEYWLAFDSYSPFLKKLAWDYQFAYVRNIQLKKRNLEINKGEIKKLLDKGIKYILLVEKYEGYDAGAYEITDNELRKANLLELKDDGVITMSKTGKLQPRNAKDFIKLFI